MRKAGVSRPSFTTANVEGLPPAERVPDRRHVTHNVGRRIFHIVIYQVQVNLGTDEQTAACIQLQPRTKLSHEVRARLVVGAAEIAADRKRSIETRALGSDSSRQLSLHLRSQLRQVERVNIPKDGAIRLR